MAGAGPATTALLRLTFPEKADDMARPPYKPGDLVELTRDFANQPRVGPFEITRLMPARDNREAQYRVRGPDGRERAIDHHEIEAAAGDGAKD